MRGTTPKVRDEQQSEQGDIYSEGGWEKHGNNVPRRTGVTFRAFWQTVIDIHTQVLRLMQFYYRVLMSKPSSRLRRRYCGDSSIRSIQSFSSRRRWTTAVGAAWSTEIFRECWLVLKCCATGVSVLFFTAKRWPFIRSLTRSPQSFSYNSPVPTHVLQFVDWRSPWEGETSLLKLSIFPSLSSMTL